MLIGFDNVGFSHIGFDSWVQGKVDTKPGELGESSPGHFESAIHVSTHFIITMEGKHEVVMSTYIRRLTCQHSILQAYRYFVIYQLLDEKKIEATILCLSGDVLAWFRWSNIR